MAGNRGLYVLPDGSSNGTTPLNARLALSGLIASDGTSALAIRQGVFYDGQGSVVVGNTDTGTMSYSVRAAVFALPLLGVTSSGAVVAVNDALFKATTTAAPGSNSRIDVIWVRQHAVASDGGPDANNIFEIAVTQGTAAASPSVPAIPTGAMALAQAVMTSGSTSTNALAFTQVHGWTAAAGAPIPVRNSTERNALTEYDGMRCYRLDTRSFETWWSSDSGWHRDPAPFPFPDAVNRPRRILTRTATFSLANNVLTAVGSWSVDTGDDGNATGLNLSPSTTITATYAGLYRVDYSMQFPAASNIIRIELLKNGTVGPPATGTVVGFIDGAGGGQQTLRWSGYVYLAAADTLIPAVFQNSGSSITCGSASATVVAWTMEWVGP